MLPARLQQCCTFHAGDRQRLEHPGTNYLRKLPLRWPTVQLQNLCPSAILGHNQGQVPCRHRHSVQVVWAGSEKRHRSCTAQWAFAAGQSHEPAPGLTRDTKTELLQNIPRGVGWVRSASYLLRAFPDQLLHWEHNPKGSGWGREEKVTFFFLSLSFLHSSDYPFCLSLSF